MTGPADSPPGGVPICSMGLSRLRACAGGCPVDATPEAGEVRIETADATPHPLSPRSDRRLCGDAGNAGLVDAGVFAALGPEGYVVNVSRVAVIDEPAHVPRPHSIAYTATKHAVTGLTRACALDGRGHDIACCQIDIGNAASDMGSALGQGVLQANGGIMAEPVMDVAQVGDAVAYMDGLPIEANVASMMIMATTMPFAGRG